MLKKWNGYVLSSPISADTPPRKDRPGVYKARDASKPDRTPMFWSWWDGECWGPITKDRTQAQNVYLAEREFYGITPASRRCQYQGLASGVE